MVRPNMCKTSDADAVVAVDDNELMHSGRGTHAMREEVNPFIDLPDILIVAKSLEFALDGDVCSL